MIRIFGLSFTKLQYSLSVLQLSSENCSELINGLLNLFVFLSPLAEPNFLEDRVHFNQIVLFLTLPQCPAQGSKKVVTMVTQQGAPEGFNITLATPSSLSLL